MVVGTSRADPSQTAEATVTVTAASQITVSVTPAEASALSGAVVHFAAEVSGSSDTTVTWSADGGAISQDVTWQAPQSAGTVHVNAASHADPTKRAQATLTVSPPEVSVSISPDHLEAVATEPTTYPFTAKVTGAADTNMYSNQAHGCVYR